jgi:hypothetical protein
MTIDKDDYAPRPADDSFSVMRTPKAPVLPDDWHRYASLIYGYFKPARCHQLGCEFSELPHG